MVRAVRAVLLVRGVESSCQSCCDPQCTSDQKWAGSASIAASNCSSSVDACALVDMK